jgi:hypothetical protein
VRERAKAAKPRALPKESDERKVDGRRREREKLTRPLSHSLSHARVLGIKNELDRLLVFLPSFERKKRTKPPWLPSPASRGLPRGERKGERERTER